MDIPLFILFGAIGYLLGSIPNAYIVVKASHGKDLRNEGSGNIGTLNAYEVTGSKDTGKWVLFLDVMKGAIPITAAVAFFESGFITSSILLVSLVLGHNYSPWIGFRGGRGLATAAGALLVYNPYFLLVWLSVWGITHVIRKDIHVANIAATVLLPLIVYFTPDFTKALAWFGEEDPESAVIAIGVLSFVIFVRHIDPLMQLIRQKASTE
ncbi:MAG: hypothetical protein CL946_04125 [Ectothiorhodospiraceae bacterium]|nr:hypothetical protein [Ectothiorhodospiraceae bacterium]